MTAAQACPQGELPPQEYKRYGLQTANGYGARPSSTAVPAPDTPVPYVFLTCKQGNPATPFPVQF